MTLLDAIRERNRPLSNVIVGSLIHRIDEATATRVAGLVSIQADKLTALRDRRDRCAYLCAVIDQESRFDPRAIAMNLSRVALSALARAVEWVTLHCKPPETAEQQIEGTLLDLVKIGDTAPASEKVGPRRSDWHGPNVDPILRSDIGIAMFNVRYSPVPMPSTFHKTVYDFLFNPEWAISQMADRYALNLAAAERIRTEGYELPAQDRVFPTIDAKWIATGAYNGGWTGFKRGYADQSSSTWKNIKKHMTRVQEHYEWFRQNLTQEV